MASCQQLDASRRARIGKLIRLSLLFAVAVCSAVAQEIPSDAERLSVAQNAFDAGKWQEAAKLAQGPGGQSPNLDFVRGLALAKLQQWNEARLALEAGHAKAPREPRFLVELAGIDYKQKNFSSAKRHLRAALRLNSRDAYTREFLGTIYFLEGNLEATLKYWNLLDKPRLRAVVLQPPPRLAEIILERAMDFNPPQILTRDAWLTTRQRLDNLGIYAHQRIDLAPASDGNYDVTLHLAERNGWGDSRLEGAMSLFSGLPYATVYPELYNLGGHAMNVTSLLRWDSEKRRAYAAFSTPFRNDPSQRFQFYFDARNENWNLSDTFFGGGPALTDLNLRRIAGGADFRSTVNGRWTWSTGIEISNRSFRNVNGMISPSEKPFFTDAASLAYWLRADRSLLRIPERRLTLDSTAEARIGRAFAQGLGAFASARASIEAHWLPLASGDDYQMQTRLRIGGTLGRVTLDDLFQLGIERDNDLWLRGHAGTSDGRKGAAPLGRRYFLANWEQDKNVFANGIFTVKLGPFLDTGAIADSSGLFGSRKWLWDTGAQCKVRVLGGVTVVLSYGRDLRGGRNVFYGTVVR
jgi:tetratricopeptide (TPR) repeat protein